LPSAPVFQTTIPKKSKPYFKTVLTKLFEGDASFACPEGNVEVMKLIWLEHNCKAGQYSSTKVHGNLKENEDSSYEPKNLEDLVSQQIDGL